jgi:hypothetical protein
LAANFLFYGRRHGRMGDLGKKRDEGEEQGGENPEPRMEQVN